MKKTEAEPAKYILSVLSDIVPDAGIKPWMVFSLDYSIKIDERRKSAQKKVITDTAVVAALRRGHRQQLYFEQIAIFRH